LPEVWREPFDEDGKWNAKPLFNLLFREVERSSKSGNAA
jgi:hypothetical protein